MLYLHRMDDLFHKTPHLFYNSEEERDLIVRRFNLFEDVGRTVGIGLEKNTPATPDPLWETLREQIGDRRVLTYVGRIEHDKGCGELVDFFLRYICQAQRSDLVLLLLGKRTLPLSPHPQILSPGFVSEFVKIQALRLSDVVIAPSRYESLCMAALEALLHGCPLLVNSRCNVLVGHCSRSNGGLWYRNYEEFAEALTTLLSDATLRRLLGEQGERYVRQNYRWDAVEQAYREVIEQIAASGPDI
jgi:glycosyltransferase involved in cell wall biosynthesis